MPLTDIAVKKIVSKEKQYRVADGKGLALLVHPNGSKYWQLRYRYGGKGKLLALGVYPEVSLAEARKKATDARSILRNGEDPSAVRKQEQLARRITHPTRLKRSLPSGGKTNASNGLLNMPIGYWAASAKIFSPIFPQDL